MIMRDMFPTWRPIPGYVGQYEVSNWGEIRSLDRVVERALYGKIITQRVPGVNLALTPNINTGHLTVNLSKYGACTMVHVHGIVAEVYIGPRPPGMQVCHNDGIPAHNWVWNLRYDTPIGNAADRYKHHTDARGSNNPRAKYTEEEILQLIELLSVKTNAQVSRETGIPVPTISSIRSGANWGHLPRPWIK